MIGKRFLKQENQFDLDSRKFLKETCFNISKISSFFYIVNVECDDNYTYLKKGLEQKKTNIKNIYEKNECYLNKKRHSRKILRIY